LTPPVERRDGEDESRQDETLMLRDLSSGEATQRRKEARAPCRSVVLMACGERESLLFEQVPLIDCSLHGIRILMPRPLELGDDILVKLKLPRIALVVYSVRHCHAEGAGYRVGAEFRNVVGADAAAAPDLAGIAACLLSGDQPPP
jgi:hypothetical protein